MDREVYLQEGAPLLVADDFNQIYFLDGHIRTFHHVEDDVIITNFVDVLLDWEYAIPLSRINMDNVEATRKEILRARDGKLIKFYNPQIADNND